MSDISRFTGKAAEGFDRRLLNFGYAPGSYIIRCISCREQCWWCDKRAARCKACAERLAGVFSSNTSAEGAGESP